MKEKRAIRIGLIQLVCSELPSENLERAIDLTREAALQGADVVCLPELFQTRYFCQTEDTGNFRLAESIPGLTTTLFSSLAGELRITIIISLFERRAPGLFHNTAAVIDADRGYLGKYRKMHIPDDPRYFEKFYFAPGDLGFKVFQTPIANLGVLICWDQWFPEAARLTALQGADIIFYPTAIGWHPDEKLDVGSRQHDAWELSQRAHAVSNGCFVVAVNRAGFEPEPGSAHPDQGIEFWGQSFVATPDGSVLYRAPAEGEILQVVSLDLTQIETARIGWPFLRDRRNEAYNGLTRKFIDTN